MYGDWPVELFVHTAESWHAFVDREIRKRRSPLLWMCADGELLSDVDGLGASRATEARKLALAGPPATTVEEIEDFRYSITDVVVPEGFLDVVGFLVGGGVVAVADVEDVVHFVVATRDHHIDPGAHFSGNPDFQDSFPVHCVVGSEGGEFHPHFAPAVDSGHVDEVFFKGAHSASKSGFEGFAKDGTTLSD